MFKPSSTFLLTVPRRCFFSGFYLFLSFKVFTNSKVGLFYSNFLILTPTFSKVPIEKYSKTPFFSSKQHFYSYFQNPLSLSLLYCLVCSLQPCFVCLFCCFTSQVNSYGHGGTVSSPNHTFSWAGLNKQLTSNSCTYFRL